MTTNKTFTMIKPDAVENGYTGAILDKINAAGFRIVALKKTHMTKRDAEAFYAVHSERPYIPAGKCAMFSVLLVLVIILAPKSV